jgi:hypothetical protein
MPPGSSIEKKSLEAHVELCAERYTTLQAKLDSLGAKVAALESHVLFIREALAGTPGKSSKMIITIGTTIIGVLIAGLITAIVALSR